jgi:hypothetical protein
MSPDGGAQPLLPDHYGKQPLTCLLSTADLRELGNNPLTVRSPKLLGLSPNSCSKSLNIAFLNGVVHQVIVFWGLGCSSTGDRCHKS